MCSKQMYTSTLENRILSLLLEVPMSLEKLFKHCMFLPKNGTIFPHFLNISTFWKRNFSMHVLSVSPVCL